MNEKTYKFRVVSTEQHKELFATRKEAEKYIKQLKKSEPFTEFRISEVIE